MAERTPLLRQLHSPHQGADVTTRSYNFDAALDALVFARCLVRNDSEGRVAIAVHCDRRAMTNALANLYITELMMHHGDELADDARSALDAHLSERLKRMHRLSREADEHRDDE
jgi:hypothetical protein